MNHIGTLCYLDVKIIRQETGTFKFTVFRKASNTGRLLDYESYSQEKCSEIFGTKGIENL